MGRHGKKYLAGAAKIDRAKSYALDEAIQLAVESRYAKFDETVEMAIRLGVDPRQADQNVRGTVILPHGTGKSVRVLVIGKGDDLDVQLASLDALYEQCDYITLHLSLTPETQGMIGREAFARMKDGVRIINCARGELIDDTALRDALSSGQVAGAALDVFAKEPPGMTALVSHPHVVATPHIGAQTVEAQARAAVDIAGEILAALRGEPLRWKVV